MNEKFNDTLKVLGYGNLSKLNSIMDSHFFLQLNAVSDEITDKPKTLKELNDYIKNGNFTHVVIPDEHFHNLEDSLKGCIVPVVELLGDHWVSWAIDKKKNYMKENGIKNAIVFSERFKELYLSLANLETVVFGYDNSEFYNKKLSRDIDILIHGSLGDDTYKWVYPVRNFLAEVLPEIGIKEGINVVHWKHPGYDFVNENVNPSEDYSNIINKSKIAIGGSSYWRLPLKKFYEVPACGTILLSDLPLEDTEFFKGNILEVNPEYINDKKYVDVIRRKIGDTLENYDKLKEELNPFKTKQDIFNRSYNGRALEMRAIISRIK